MRLKETGAYPYIEVAIWKPGWPDPLSQITAQSSLAILFSPKIITKYNETCVKRPLKWVVYQYRWSFMRGKIHMIV